MKPERRLHTLSTTRRSVVLAWLCTALATPALGQLPGTSVPVASAKPGEVRVLVSNGLRAPLETVRARAEQAIRRPLVIQYGNSRLLQDTIDSGQPFEVAIVTPDVLEAAAAKGRALTTGRADVARVPGGIAQRGGAARKDISTPEALKATILGAKSIRFLATGAVRPTVDKTFATLGVADAVQGRIRPLPGPNSPVLELGPGEYELIFNLASEHLTPPPGTVYLGYFPAELQVPAVMAAGIGAAGDTVAARALIDFLMGPAIEPALQASLMSR